MYNHLLDYLHSENILVPNQYGLLEKHSTSISILKLVYEISYEVDKKK